MPTSNSSHLFSTKSLENLIKKVRQAILDFPDESNKEFREFYLESDKSQIKIVVPILILSIALFSIGDYMPQGSPIVFYSLIGLRIILIIYSIVYLKFALKIKNFQSYDKNTLTYLMIITAGILTINLTRPQNFLPHVIVIDIAIFVFYLALPNRLIYQVIPSLTFTTGEIIIIMVTFESITEVPALITAISSLIFANFLAFLIALELHLYRWRIFQNIKQRKETDRLAAIGQTAGMIGHDIRNPLQAIANEVYVAKQAMNDYPVEFTKEALESIGIIEEQADYISKIVSDLQDYARPLKPEFQEIEIAKLFTSIFQTINIPERIAIKFDFIRADKLKTDPTLLRRALTNLINNAIQAMPKGGKLELSAVQEEHITITVSDTGQGIPEDIKPKLFTPLVTSKAKGQGLGLAVVKRIIEALNGTITFESQEGKGTKFIINMPIEPSSA